VNRIVGRGSVLVAPAAGVAAVLAVAEVFVGAEDRLGVHAPEVAVADDFLSGGEAGVDVEAFGEEVAAAFALEDLKIVVHGFPLGVIDCGWKLEIRISKSEGNPNLRISKFKQDDCV
jgi:hypothetical protein